MEFDLRIKKDGTMVTEVLNRGTVEHCSNIRQVTSALGVEIQDEVIGPECDKVEEIIGIPGDS